MGCKCGTERQEKQFYFEHQLEDDREIRLLLRGGRLQPALTTRSRWRINQDERVGTTRRERGDKDGNGMKRSLDNRDCGLSHLSILDEHLMMRVHAGCNRLRS